MSIIRRRPLSIGALLVALCLMQPAAKAATQDDPGYLVLARDLVRNIEPENNQYTLGGRFISFPGDAPAASYAMRADCSGFLLAIFERAGYSTLSNMTYASPQSRRKRPAAEDFVASIEQEKGFKRVTAIADMQPGDLLAHAMLSIEDKRHTGTTGHVFLIDSRPQSIRARPPIVDGTRQFEVSIIDSNDEHVGDDDSRRRNKLAKVAGLGTGTIRLYADDRGQLVGWARTFARSDKFFSYDPRFPSDTKPRKAAIGRPVK